MKKSLFAFLALVAALVAAPSLSTPAVAQPCQWNYGFVNNVATATYCGVVQSAGGISLTSVGSITAMQALPQPFANQALIVSGKQGAGSTFVFTSTPCGNAGAGDGGTQFPPDAGVGCWTRQFSSYIAPAWFGAACDGVTLDTIAIQKWVSALSVLNQPGQLPNSRCNIGLIVMHGAMSMYGGGSLSGFNMIGAGAGFNRDANINGMTWTNINFFGDNVLADNQYALIGNSSFTLTNFSLNNVSASGLTNAIDLSYAFDGFVSGGTVGPTLGDGTVSGTGYCMITGFPDNTVTPRSVRIVGVKFIGCARHSLYMGAGVAINSSNNQFINHRIGIPFANLYASLIMSRGADFSDNGSVFYNCNEIPIGLDDDTQFGHAATTFTIANESFYNCPYPIQIGANVAGGAPTLDNIALSVTGLNWHAGANTDGGLPTGTAVTIYGCNVCKLSGNFDFSTYTGFTTTVTPIVIHNGQNRGPFALSIDANARITTTGSNSALVEIGTQAASSVSSEIFIDPSSNVVGGNLILPDAEIQTSNIRAPGNNAVKTITGATPYVAAYVNFSLTQTGATNVTNFQQGYPGQTIFVQCGDSNSTFIDSTSIHTKTRANTVCANGTMVTFKSQGGTWFQQ